MGGSLKIFLSCGWFCIRCHFPTRMLFRLGNAGWYCATKGSIFLRAALFFCSSLVFLSEKFTSDRCFFITPVGYPLHLRRDSKFWMFCSKVSFDADSLLTRDEDDDGDEDKIPNAQKSPRTNVKEDKPETSKNKNNRDRKRPREDSNRTPSSDGKRVHLNEDRKSVHPKENECIKRSHRKTQRPP